MSPGKLKLFSPAAADRTEPSMQVALGDLVPLLVDAVQTDRTWLRDFAAERVRVSPDLYDVLLAYQQMRRCDAA